MLQLDGVQLPELKCRCLNLKFHITKFNLYGVASLLQASPHMETLNIDMESGVSSYIFCSSWTSIHLWRFNTPYTENFQEENANASLVINRIFCYYKVSHWCAYIDFKFFLHLGNWVLFLRWVAERSNIYFPEKFHMMWSRLFIFSMIKWCFERKPIADKLNLFHSLLGLPSPRVF